MGDLDSAWRGGLLHPGSQVNRIAHGGIFAGRFRADIPHHGESHGEEPESPQEEETGFSDQGKKDILGDYPASTAGYRESLGDPAGVAVHKYHVGRLDGGVGNDICDGGKGTNWLPGCNDKRGTKDFRIKVAGVLARRAAAIALERAKEQS